MYKVGMATGVLKDEMRNNWAGNGPRPIPWVAWYPADNNAHGKRLCIEHSAKDAPFVVRGGYLNDAINMHQRNWPVVLLSHGTGGSALGMDWLGSRLAAAGFISLSVSHHGNTILEPYLPEGFLCWWERASDLSLTLDALANEGPLAQAIDTTRVFAAGFSLGAYTVLSMVGARTDVRLFKNWLEQSPRTGPNGPKEFPDLSEHIPNLVATSTEFRTSQDRQHKNYCDPRIKAIVALAPPPPIRALTPQSLGEIEVPVHIIVGQGDNEAPHHSCAQWLHKLLPHSHLRLLGKNVGHYVFLNEATQFGKTVEPEICIDAKGVDRSTIHHQTALVSLKLFNNVMADLPA